MIKETDDDGIKYSTKRHFYRSITQECYYDDFICILSEAAEFLKDKDMKGFEFITSEVIILIRLKSLKL